MPQCNLLNNTSISLPTCVDLSANTSTYHKPIRRKMLTSDFLAFVPFTQCIFDKNTESAVGCGKLSINMTRLKVLVKPLCKINASLKIKSYSFYFCDFCRNAKLLVFNESAVTISLFPNTEGATPLFPLNDARWHHTCFVYVDDNTNPRWTLYKDGQRTNSQTIRSNRRHLPKR